MLLRLAALALAAAALDGETLRYWVEPCTKPETGCHEGDVELAEWAMAAWQAASHGGLVLERSTDRFKAHIRINWVSGQEGLYGEARPFMLDGVRGAEVYVLPPDNVASDDLLRDTVVYLTCLHETGHALGLNHTAEFADIMYSFQYGGNIPEYFGRYRRRLKARADIRKNSGMSSEDEHHLAAIYRK
jgi:hypothetical protein